MKKIENYQVITNEPLTKDVYKMVLKGDSSWIDNPGQFINVTVKNGYLKRPISICDYDETSITIIYRVIGKGSEYLASLKENDQLEALVGLGNGFDTSKASDEVLIVGGGVGIPPLYGLAKKCLKEGKKVKVVLGFMNKDACFYAQEFKALGAEVYLCSNDGSIGSKGLVTDVIKAQKLEDIYYFACGPLAMLKAVSALSTNQGQLSFEERMGCGFGACMGCSHKTKSGYIRICSEGPVIESKEVLWED